MLQLELGTDILMFFGYDIYLLLAMVMVLVVVVWVWRQVQRKIR